MQLSTKQGERKGTASKAENECVQTLGLNSYSSVEALRKEIFVPEELATLEEFFSAPVGKKYVRFNVLQI